MNRRRSCSLVAAAALVTALLASAPTAGAASSFTFFGSGNGHGLGMSQWGAHGLARMGWNHEEILTHFYRGTTVERSGDLPGRIRVEIASGRTTVHLKARRGRVRLWVGDPLTGASIGAIPRDRTWTVTARAKHYAVRSGSGRLIGGRTWGGPSRHLFATYEDNGAHVFVPEADTIGRGFEYSRGHLEFNLYACAGGCAERVIVSVGFEEYLYGLAEVSTSWPVETLRAQAVAARSYAAATIRGQGGTRAGCNCHLTDGAGDQVYKGYSHEGSAGGDRWVHAVRDTDGKVVTFNGTVVQAFYASSDGGHSENVEDVWHGGNDAYSLPWLKGVCDPGESTAGNPWLDWKVRFSAETLTSRLRPWTRSIGRIRDFGSIDRGRSGRIITAVLIGVDGHDRVEGTELRSALGLPDTRVWINSDRNIVAGPIREEYDDLGCAPGLATSKQIVWNAGRQQLFETGGIFHNDDERLTIWLQGAFFREYDEVGAGRGELGLPTSAIVDLTGGEPRRAIDCSSCARMNFQRGRIYQKEGVGAHALWGRVLDTYLERKGPEGALGFPTDRVRKLSGGGLRATFEYGRIECPQGDPCVVS